MPTHKLHLHPEPFVYIRSGSKTVESRLFDEKRRNYRIGDKLIFINRADESELIESTIVDLHKEQSFQDLFMSKKTLGKFSTTSIDKLLDGIELYYSKKDQEKYGVIGIEFKIDRIS
jgi:ASC-1-like (ASCH) protein